MVFDDIIEPLLEVLLFPITPILEPIARVAALFEKIFNLLISVVNMFPRILEIFFYVTDPRKLINDLFFGVIKGVYMISDAILDTLFGDLRRQFGNKSDKGSNVSGGSGLNQKEKCIPPSLVDILILVLCPPLAIMLRKGLNGLFYVLIANFV